MLAILYGNQGNVGNSNKRIVSNLGPSGLEGLLFHCPSVPSLAPCWVPPLPLPAIGPKVVKLGLSRCALSNCDRLHQQEAACSHNPFSLDRHWHWNARAFHCHMSVSPVSLFGCLCMSVRRYLQNLPRNTKQTTQSFGKLFMQEQNDGVFEMLVEFERGKAMKHSKKSKRGIMEY